MALGTGRFPSLVSFAARSLAGARRACFVGILLLAGAAPAGAERFEGAPPWRAGGRVAFTLDAAARPDTAGWVLDVFLRVPPATLRQLGRDEAGNAMLRAVVRVRGSFGAKRAEVTRDFVIPAGDTTYGQGRVLLLRFPAGPGPCKLWARLEDPLSRKRGLLYSARSMSEFALVEGETEVPGAQAGRWLSDIGFLWPDSAQAGESFRRAGRVALPNPERLYGLWAPSLRAAFTALGPVGSERPWHWLARVYDDSARVVAQQESTAVAGRWLEGSCHFDLSSEPAGGYVLEVKAWQDGDTGALLRRGAFSLAWRPDTWARSAADVTDEVHFLLEAESEEAFLQLQPGEQELYLDRFWALRDPTPETAVNEAYETFRRRIEHANRTYTRFGIDRGMFSDMGRTYVRYGEPSEVLNQVMPAGDDDLVRVLEQLNAEEDRAVGVGAKRGDQRAWEVWIYEGEVSPPIDADPRSAIGQRGRRRLVFLFVDEQGTGHFTQRYSTE